MKPFNNPSLKIYSNPRFVIEMEYTTVYKTQTPSLQGFTVNGTLYKWHFKVSMINLGIKGTMAM